MALLRLFIGAPLPESYQELLGELRDSWNKELRSKLTWTKPGNWHITLKFLGDTDEALLPELKEALAQIAWTGYPLQGGGGGFFQPPKPSRPPRPRVVWVGLRQGAAETIALAAAVEAALTPLGVAAAERPFRPHLTLARVKYAAKEDAVSGTSGDKVAGDKVAGRPAPGWSGVFVALQAMHWPVCSMDAFVLWQSRLMPSGPVYTPLDSFPARG